MRVVNMLNAKSNLSKLVDAVESGAEREIVIARAGRPAVRIVPLAAKKPVRIGIADGRYKVPQTLKSSTRETPRLPSFSRTARFSRMICCQRPISAKS